jgi:tRNA(Ile)-lysidine synthase
VTALLDEVRRFAERHAMWRSGTRVVAAVSGGSDSVAMLFLLKHLSDCGDLTLDAIAHLNHAIRGVDADADEAFCRTLTERLDLPFVSSRVDVPERARRDGTSLELASRVARREFFDDVLKTRRADVIATAHTRDDQAETVLLRIVRGTGLTGLGGIAPMRDRRVRPLLDVSRAELRAYLHDRGETWREDATNADLSNPRNRVRHEVLPYLEQHFNPSVAQALGRLADLARADEEVLGRQADAAFASSLDVERDRVRLDAAALTALPVAIARRVVQRAFDRLLGGVSRAFDDVEAVRAVAAGNKPRVQLSGVQVEHSGPFVVLVSNDSVSSPPAPFRFDLSIPGAVTLPRAGWTVEAQGPLPRQPGNEDVGAARAQSEEVQIEAAGLGSHLVVRSRQAGDRVRPLGLGGEKKLQDVFVDRKVSRKDRDDVPIVTDKEDRIVWVAGHVLGEEFRVTEHTKAVVVLKLRRI